MQTNDAIELYRREVAARGGSFFWPTKRWPDGTRHFVAEPDWNVCCPRCDSEIVILHPIHRDAAGVRWRHITCAMCYREWRDSTVNAVAYQFSTMVYRG